MNQGEKNEMVLSQSTTNNCFNVDMSREYRCQVEYFSIGHGLLEISVNSIGNSFLLIFTGVAYFSGPVRWIGANFQIDSQKACFDLLSEIGLADMTQDGGLALLECYRLYALDLPRRTTLKILAQSGMVKSYDKSETDTVSR